MEVLEEFLSIQGEGSLVGTPAYFIRLARCNLRCPWCDTKYSWKPGKEASPREVALRAASSSVPLVVITGGEPLLWEREVAELVSSLRELGFRGIVQIETNGTIYPKSLEDTDVWITVSPKVTCDYYVNSPDVVKKIAQNFKSEIKLVVRKEDLRCAKRFLEEVGDVNVPIVLQPLHEKDYAAESRALVEAVLEDPDLRKKVRVVPQVHKLLGLP